MIALARNTQYRRANGSGLNWLDYLIEESGLAGRSFGPSPLGRTLDRIVALQDENLPRLLVPGPWAAPLPSFSPDGQLLVYRFGGKALLCRVRDGGLLFALEGQPRS